jgi:hypothetical protein
MLRPSNRFLPPADYNMRGELEWAKRKSGTIAARCRALRHFNSNDHVRELHGTAIVDTQWRMAFYRGSFAIKKRLAKSKGFLLVRVGIPLVRPINDPAQSEV